MQKRLHSSLVRLFSAGLLAGTLATGVVAVVHAADSPGAYQGSGRIDHIDQSKNIVVIDDSQFNLAGNVQVRGGGSKYSLSKGMNVGYTFVPASRDRTIIQIWVLPAN